MIRTFKAILAFWRFMYREQKSYGNMFITIGWLVGWAVCCPFKFCIHCLHSPCYYQNVQGLYIFSGQGCRSVEGPQLQDLKHQHNRILSLRGSLTGPAPPGGFSVGAGYIASSPTSWLPEIKHSPVIVFRPVRPSDLDVLKEMHEILFPVKYEPEFFLNVVNGRGIVSWAAVDTSRAGLQCDEIIGFVTTRLVSTTDIDTTGMLGYEIAKTDRHLVYILTLGVNKHYRNLGIASSLIQKVLEYATSIPTCRAVYLHVISYNLSAIHFYEKNAFRCLQRLENFYYINEHHYDAYLYILYVNGGRSPCSALDFLVSMSGFVRSFFTSIAGRFWPREAKKTAKWSKYKNLGGVFSPFRRIHGRADGITISSV